MLSETVPTIAGSYGFEYLLDCCLLDWSLILCATSTACSSYIFISLLDASSLWPPRDLLYIILTGLPLLIVTILKMEPLLQPNVVEMRRLRAEISVLCGAGPEEPDEDDPPLHVDEVIFPVLP